MTDNVNELRAKTPEVSRERLHEVMATIDATWAGATRTGRSLREEQVQRLSLLFHISERQRLNTQEDPATSNDGSCPKCGTDGVKATCLVDGHWGHS